MKIVDFAIGLICTALFFTSAVADENIDVRISGKTDNVNYFTIWNCESLVGINTIQRLNILPLSTHSPKIWKDSLFASFKEQSRSGDPRLYFTIGTHNQLPGEPVFRMAYADFDPDENRWIVTEYMNDGQDGGGVSSHDGELENFVFNEYKTPGWGPFSNKSGLNSAYPGVSTKRETFIGINSNSMSKTIGYPLTGSGPTGLSSIRNYKQVDGGDPNTQTCLHMNPTMFVDAVGRPSMVATLWARGANSRSREACMLPSGRKLPAAGNYIYHFIDEELGWQLDVERGLIGTTGNDAMNAIHNTMNKLIATQYGNIQNDLDSSRANPSQKDRNIPAALQLVDIDAGTILDLLTCGKPQLHFAEASGKADRIYFLVDYPEKSVPFVHDVFVAFREKTSN